MIPNIFYRPRLPKKLPPGMRRWVDQLRGAPSKETCLRRAYALMSKKYRGYRIKTYTQLLNIFRTDLDTLWNQHGFLHCTTMNYLFRVLLVKSGQFSESDLRFRWCLVWVVSPHQYLQVRIRPGIWIDVDLWGKAYGIKLGDHAQGFH